MQSLIELDRYAANARLDRDRVVMVKTMKLMLKLTKESMERNRISEERALKIIGEIEQGME